MSTLLSRPLLIDQSDHNLEIPDGRLENITESGAPHPLTSIALQASLGLAVSHLFQKMSTENSIELVLEIEAALEKWMGTFPASMRDHRPETRWDQKSPNVPFMRCQVNAIAYCYLLAPLKPYLLGDADPNVLKSTLGADLRRKGVDACLDLMKAVEKFHDLIFPASIKYFYIIFFMFDAAMVLCSAIVHDNASHTLPKRSQCLRSLRTAQELMDTVAHLSESARISAQLLRKLAETLPLSSAEKQILGVATTASGKLKSVTLPRVAPDPGIGAFDFNSVAAPAAMSAAGLTSGLVSDALAYDAMLLQQQTMAAAGGFDPHATYAVPDWTGYVDYGTAGVAGGGLAPGDDLDGFGTTVAALPSSMPPVAGMNGVMGGPAGMGMQPGDPLTGTYLNQVWDWDRLNMDLTGTQFGL